MPIVNAFLWVVIVLVGLLGYEIMAEYRQAEKKVYNQLRRMSPSMKTRQIPSASRTTYKVSTDEAFIATAVRSAKTGCRQFLDVGKPAWQKDSEATGFSFVLPSGRTQSAGTMTSAEHSHCA